MADEERNAFGTGLGNQKSKEQFDGSSNKVDECINSVKKTLTENVPKTVKVDFSFENSIKKDTIISKSNAQANSLIDMVQRAVVKAYDSNEEARTKHQKVLLYLIATFTGLQLLVFNFIIAGAVWLSFKSGDRDIIVEVMIILKYYIGATVAELIGMIVFITTATFSKNHVKTMEHLMDSRQIKRHLDDKKK